MKKAPGIFVLVKNFEGINSDVELYESFEDAKAGFNDYTGFRFNGFYNDPQNERYDERFSETKIFELDLPGFLESKKGGGLHEGRK